MIKTDYTLKNRKIATIGNSYGISLPPSVANKYDFDYQTRIRIEMRYGVCVVTRMGEQAPLLDGSSDEFQTFADDDEYMEQELAKAVLHLRRRIKELEMK